MDGDGNKYSSMTIERVSEEETSQVQLARTPNQTVIEEVITRVEETEKEVIEEKQQGETRRSKEEECLIKMTKIVVHLCFRTNVFLWIIFLVSFVITINICLIVNFNE